MREKAECYEWTKQIFAIIAGFRPRPDQNNKFVHSIYFIVVKQRKEYSTHIYYK